MLLFLCNVFILLLKCVGFVTSRLHACHLEAAKEESQAKKGSRLQALKNIGSFARCCGISSDVGLIYSVLSEGSGGGSMDWGCLSSSNAKKRTVSPTYQNAVVRIWTTPCKNEVIEPLAGCEAAKGKLKMNCGMEIQIPAMTTLHQ